MAEQELNLSIFLTRNIKFRVWDPKTKEMSFANKLNLLEGQTYTKPELMLMQYTGFEDGIGQEIYVGDILKTGAENFAIANIQGKYMGISNNFENKYDLIALYSNWFKSPRVIGNVFETPELMEKEWEV